MPTQDALLAIHRPCELVKNKSFALVLCTTNSYKTHWELSFWGKKVGHACFIGDSVTL